MCVCVLHSHVHLCFARFARCDGSIHWCNTNASDTQDYCSTPFKPVLCFNNKNETVVQQSAVVALGNADGMACN